MEYCISVESHLDESWADRLGGLTITHEPDGTTTLRGPLPDQIALHNVLSQVRNLNLRLLSVRRIAPAEKVT